MSSTFGIDTVNALIERPKEFWKFSSQLSQINIGEQDRQAFLKLSADDWVNLLAESLGNPKLVHIAAKFWENGTLSYEDEQAAADEVRELINAIALWGGLGIGIFGIVALLVAYIGFFLACLGLAATLAAAAAAPATAGLSVPIALAGVVAAAAGLILAFVAVAGVAFAIMAVVASYMPDTIVRSVGTKITGGNGGHAFNDDPAKMTTLRRIVVYATDGMPVRAIQFFWDDLKNPGGLIPGELHGDIKWRTPKATILDLGAGEFVTRITGRSGIHVNRIIFHTNHRALPSVGDDSEPNFTLEPEYGARILGLLGRCGESIDAIGTMSEVYGSDQKGGMGGHPFLDRMPTSGRLKRIAFRSGTYIDSIQLTHEVDGQDVVETRHGGNGGSAQILEILPSQRVVKISGRCGVYVDSIRIDLIDTFTGTPTFFAIGGAGGENAYSFDIPADKHITGFWGRSGELIDAIGICVA